MLNRDVLTQNPDIAIPNDGVAKVGRTTSDNDWKVLRFELQTFVCEGEYAKGLDRVLDAFLGAMELPVQPAAWISGFYGSGKSHFVRVLDALWSDIEFPDGARARSIVQKLPESIEASLRELTIRGRQNGGLWSASGQLAKSLGSPRLGLLDVMLESAGLPAGFGPGKFVLWLHEDGYEKGVREVLSRSGKSLEREAMNLYVSPSLGNALVEAIPGFAADSASARAALKAQFGPVTDITDDQLFDTMRQIMLRESTDEKKQKMPLTLIVLDEVQQYIGDESSRSYEIQNIVEGCTSQFGSRLLLAATGQSALAGTSQLQRLQGRFTVRVQLSDKDVHEVVQRVVLQKRADAIPILTKLVDDSAAEIDKQLAGTKIGKHQGDQKDLVGDYPLLPSRRRFIEAVLRAVDSSGTAGQARSQLKVIQQAVREVAGAELGTVIPGDAVFDQKRTELLQSGELLPETDRAIDTERTSGKPDAELRARLLGLVFLISKLPTKGLEVAGVRSTPTMLADLLVDDISESSSAFREQVRMTLDAMTDEGLLISVEGEYHIQTQESQEWQGAYKARMNQLKQDTGRMSGDRAQELRKAIGDLTKNLTVLVGATKTKREWTLHHGSEPPSADTGTIPVWVRDEWSVTESSARTDSQAAGVNSPVITLFLPRKSPEDLRNALASYAAATETLETRPAPTTVEGIQARGAMQTQQESDRARLNALITSVIEGARVFQGGGTEITAMTTFDAIRQAVSASALRLYPKFDVGDATGWSNVVKRANEGNGNPLSALGYSAEVDKNPVCAELLSFLGQSRTGNQIRSHFQSPPYGWPQDTIYGGLLALVVDGQIRATETNKARTAKELIHTQIGRTDFVRENQPLSINERIALADVLKETIGAVSTAEVTTALPQLLNRLADLDVASGGNAPLPAPEHPALLAELRSLNGVAQLREAYEKREQLRTWYLEWSDRKVKSATRLPKWNRLQELLKHASNLETCKDFRSQAEAIRTDRTLLVDPDPVSSLIQGVTDALRSALQDARQRHVDARKHAVDQLNTTPEWKKLSDDQWAHLLADQGLGVLPPLEIGTEDQLIRELERRSLSTWSAEIDAFPTRMQNAHATAAKMLQPKAVKVTVKNATLATPDETETYLAELRSRIIESIEAGYPVLIQGA